MEYKIAEESRRGRDGAERPCIFILSGAHDDLKRLEERLSECYNRAVFVYVRVPDWNSDMTPWPAPSLRREGEPFGGCADTFIESLVSKVLPEVLQSPGCKISWCAVAGYSLAGLCAIYSLYRTGVFSRAVSASGSVWYDGFLDYCLSHEFAGRPEKVYFSLGDKEKKTRNVRMASVEKTTGALSEHYRELGIETIFELNPGNHTNDPDGRLKKGIAWILD